MANKAENELGIDLEWGPRTLSEAFTEGLLEASNQGSKEA